MNSFCTCLFFYALLLCFDECASMEMADFCLPDLTPGVERLRECGKSFGPSISLISGEIEYWRNINVRGKSSKIISERTKNKNCMPIMAFEWGGGGNTYHCLFVTDKSAMLIKEQRSSFDENAVIPGMACVEKKIPDDMLSFVKREASLLEEHCGNAQLSGGDLEVYFCSIWNKETVSNVFCVYHLQHVFNLMENNKYAPIRYEDDIIFLKDTMGIALLYQRIMSFFRDTAESMEVTEP